MANESYVPLTPGLPETVLPDPPPAATAALAAANATAEGAGRKEAVAKVAADYPRWSAPWADLADLAAAGGAVIESYAYARVGYHRGLDSLRAAGWRGNGYVRWQHPSNQGFLRALEALRRAAEAIGEEDEEERCAVFLAQLDPGLAR